jgi:hypothetical protein
MSKLDHTFEKDFTMDDSYMIGRHLGQAVGIWLLFHLVFLRKRGALISLLALGVIIAIVFSIAINRQPDGARAMAALQEDFNRVASVIHDPDKHIDPISTTPVTKGEQGEIERFFRAEFNERIALRNDYFRELEAIGWNMLLDAKRLENEKSANAKSMPDSIALVAKARATIDKHQQRSNEFIQASIARAREALDLPPARKRAFIAGLEQGFKNGQEVEQKLWQMERDIVGESETLILILANSDKWEVEADQIIFHDDDELARFNASMEKIAQIAQTQMQTHENTVTRINKTIDEQKR